MRMTTLIYTESLKIVEILVVRRELKKKELFSQETYQSQNFRYETLKSPLLKKTKCVPHESHKRLKVHFLSFSLITGSINMNKYMIEFLCL